LTVFVNSDGSIETFRNDHAADFRMAVQYVQPHDAFAQPPDAGGGVGAARGETFTVCAEGQRHGWAGVTVERAAHRACIDIPELNTEVDALHRQRVTVRTEGQRLRAARGEARYFVATGQAPQPCHIVRAAGRQRAAIR